MADEKIINEESTMPSNFIHDFIDEDIAKGGQYEGMTVHTRFPPELTDTCTSAMQRLSALISEQLRNTAVCAT